MQFNTKRQRFPGYPGDWNLDRVWEDETGVMLFYLSDAPGNRQALVVDGETGKVLSVCEHRGRHEEE